MNLWKNHIIISAGEVNKINLQRQPQYLKITIKNILNINYSKSDDDAIVP